MGKIKVAIIGLGFMGRNHYRIVKKLSDYYELKAVCDIDPRAKEGIKDANFYESAEEMLERESLDALIISVQPKDNLKIIDLALNFRIKNIFVEKPLTTLDQLDSAKSLIEKEARIMVGEIICYDPATIALKENLKELGKLNSIVSLRSGKYPFRFIDVGVDEDLLVHDLTFARYLLDWQKFEIKSQIKEKIFRESQIDFIAIEAFSEKGVKFIAIASWLTEEKIRVATVLGEKAIAQINFLDENKYVRIFPPEVIRDIRTGTIEEFRRLERERSNIAKELKLLNMEPLEIEHRHFIDCISNGREPLTNLKRSIETLEILKETRTDKR